MNVDTKQAIHRLVADSRDAVVCSVDENGYPNAKTMFRRHNEGIRTFWFSSNISAIRTGQWLERPQACVYFDDPVDFHGLMLTGRMEVLTDNATKLAFWQEGDEMYYSQGPSDPDYCILRFTAEAGNYYHGLQKILFQAEEAES